MIAAAAVNTNYQPVSLLKATTEVTNFPSASPHYLKKGEKIGRP